MELPTEDSVQQWCWRLVTTETLGEKLAEGAVGDAWEVDPPARRPDRPGRPPELRVVAKSPRTPRPAALRRPEVRAELLHTLAHHELQAAELFAWAVLAFPDTPQAFRAGLVRLAQDELRHLRLYDRELRRLGFAYGAFPVRDWFWERVSTCPDAASFVALQGLGLEGANLEHAARLAQQLRAGGDPEAAAVLEQVEREEISHVAFAVRWFQELTGEPLDYDRWRECLPRPLTPAILRGPALNRAARRRAGLDETFMSRLEAEPRATATNGR